MVPYRSLLTSIIKIPLMVDHQYAQRDLGQEGSCSGHENSVGKHGNRKLCISFLMTHHLRRIYAMSILELAVSSSQVFLLVVSAGYNVLPQDTMFFRFFCRVDRQVLGHFLMV